MQHILKFYSRKDIQKEIVKYAKHREVAVKYGDRGYGRRPDVLLMAGDVLDMARNGATSFHISEERWIDPLSIKTGMTRKQLDDLRNGWDLLLDVDSNFLEYAKITAALLVDALSFHDIKTIGLKFSGRSGMHLMVPFESFPSLVNHQSTKLFFPESTKAIANYLKTMIEKPLREEILSMSSLQEIQKATGKSFDQLMKGKQFNPFKLVDIDPVLISSRHLFRSPYSFNEKSGLVSIPIQPQHVRKFRIASAKHDRVSTDVSFINVEKAVPEEARQLLIQAFDWNQKNVQDKVSKETHDKVQKEFKLPEKAITPDFFPPCIQLLLSGVQKDGRKRAVFILSKFLHHAGYDQESIKGILFEWNKKNYEPLAEGYILGQMDWQRRQKDVVLAPNCNNLAYYQDLGVCKPDHLCSMIKNPVQYTSRKVWAKEQFGKKPKLVQAKPKKPMLRKKSETIK